MVSAPAANDGVAFAGIDSEVVNAPSAKQFPPQGASKTPKYVIVPHVAVEVGKVIAVTFAVVYPVLG